MGYISLVRYVLVLRCGLAGVVWCGIRMQAEALRVVRRTPSHCSTTQHDMLPQHLVCKYELNFEYCNITLARNKAP